LSIFIIFLLTPGRIFADPPEIKKDCELCHLPHKKGEKVLLKKPVEQLCLECHPDRKGPHEHTVDVKPSFSIPKELPLTEEGLISCITCHAPHGEGNYRSMLRVKPEELCSYCHKK
jgi:predicted CXXCH cytochrome family protein